MKNKNEEIEELLAKLIIANKELAYQNEEKEKRAAELIIANKELAFQNEEKEKRAEELVIANKELAFQNEEKEKRAAELLISNNALFASELRYHRLFEAAKEGIIILDAETGMIVDVNPFLIEMLGYMTEYFFQKAIWEIGPLKDIIQNKDNFFELQQKGHVRYEDIPLESKDGKMIHVEFVSNVYEVDQKKVIQYNIRDITERKQAEKVLTESELKYRNIFSNSPIGIYKSDRDGNIITSNSRLAEILGFDSVEELLRINMSNIYINPKERDNYISKFEFTDSVKDVALHWKKKDGLPIWININLHTVKDEKNNVVAFEGFVQDITERKDTEEALISSEEKFRSVVDNIGIGVSLISPNMEILALNKKMRDWFPYVNISNKPICYKTFNVPPSEERCSYCPTCKTLEDGLVHESITESPGKEGIVNYRVVSSPIKDSIGTVISAIEMVEDITEQRRAEEELLQQKEQIGLQNIQLSALNEDLIEINKELYESKGKAEESDRLKTAFLQNMSHEIRTPLNGIIGFSKLLQTENNSIEEINEFTDIIQQSSNRLLDIVNNVLDISKIETGQIEIHCREFQLNSLITDLYSFFSPIAKEKGLGLYFHTNQDDENSYIDTDDTKLNQIFTNLINNSIKFTSTGSIDFGYNIMDGSILFYVKDTGIGIPTEHHNKVFDRFTQVDLSISRSYEGAGLGLAICKGLVELLGGKIWFESEYGSSTTFYFEMPLILTKENGVMSQTESKIIILPNKPIILIAEDNETSFKYLEKSLIKAEIIVMRAENGEQAVEIVRNNPEINLILMDIKMPLMDGLEATKQIKMIRPELPIIAQSAFAFIEEKNNILSAGCDDYISKPIDINKLIRMINKLIK